MCYRCCMLPIGLVILSDMIWYALATLALGQALHMFAHLASEDSAAKTHCGSLAGVMAVVV